MFSMIHPCSACAEHIKKTQQRINSKYGVKIPFTVAWNDKLFEPAKEMAKSVKVLEEEPPITILRYQGNI